MAIVLLVQIKPDTTASAALPKDQQSVWSWEIAHKQLRTAAFYIFIWKLISYPTFKGYQKDNKYFWCDQGTRKHELS